MDKSLRLLVEALSGDAGAGAVLSDMVKEAGFEAEGEKVRQLLDALGPGGDVREAVDALRLTRAMFEQFPGLSNGDDEVDEADLADLINENIGDSPELIKARELSADEVLGLYTRTGQVVIRDAEWGHCGGEYSRQVYLPEKSEEGIFIVQFGLGTWIARTFWD